MGQGTKERLIAMTGGIIPLLDISPRFVDLSSNAK